MSVPYPRFYENKSRKYVDGKRYRLGNSNHPQYSFYKEYGMPKTLKYMDLYEQKFTPSRIGDMSEYYSVTWLWDQGYEVFKNAGSSGMVDMVAWNPDSGELLLIDVKTSRGKRTPSTGRTEKQKDNGIRILGYNADTRHLKFMRHRDERFSRRYI